MDDRLILTVEEAAGLLGISRGLAYEAVRTGQIPSISIGRRRLVARAALERLLDQHETGPALDTEPVSEPYPPADNEQDQTDEA